MSECHLLLRIHAFPVKPQARVGHVTDNDWHLEQPIALNVHCAPAFFKLTAASSVNMEYSHEESPHSAVGDFSPQPSQSPADFSDLDGDEREEEEPRGFGVKPYMFEPLSTAGREREPAHPRDVWSCATLDN